MHGHKESNKDLNLSVCVCVCPLPYITPELWQILTKSYMFLKSKNPHSKCVFCFFGRMTYRFCVT